MDLGTPPGEFRARDIRRFGPFSYSLYQADPPLVPANPEGTILPDTVSHPHPLHPEGNLLPLDPPSTAQGDVPFVNPEEGARQLQRHRRGWELNDRQHRANPTR